MLRGKCPTAGETLLTQWADILGTVLSFDDLVVIKGAGDLATGVAYRLRRAGFPVVMTEIAQPTVVRRTVSFAQAVFHGAAEVEGMRARLVATPDEALTRARDSEVAVIVDPSATIIQALQPSIVVDAIVAKRNTGTSIDDAPAVIALGPGFRADIDVHAVIETNRGHRLGRVIWNGEAEPDTGIPGLVDGHGADRVLRAPASGTFVGIREIGDRVSQGDVVGYVEGRPVVVPFDGCLRGLIHTDVRVHRAMKIGDVDPRATVDHCFTISDKALAIGGGVLEAAMYLLSRASLLAGIRA